MTRTGRRKGGLLRMFFTVTVALLAIWFLWKVLGETGLKGVGSRLATADRLLLLLATVLTIARYLVVALRWEVLARHEAPVGFGQISPVLMAGNFLSLVTPAVRIAGPILRAYYLSRETGRPRARFYGTIVADQTSNFTIYAVVFAGAGMMVSTRGSLSLSWTLMASLMVALFGGLWIGYRMLQEVALGRPSLAARLLTSTFGQGAEGGWRTKFIAWWEHLLHSLSGAALAPAAWWPAMGLSCLAYALTVAPQVLAFRAVGVPISVTEVSFAIAGAGFAQVMLAAPGGAGITEASLVAVFMALGLDGESSAAGVILARLINYAVVAPWGGYCFFVLQRRYGRPDPAPQTASPPA